MAEGILLRSSGIQPSSVSKGAPRISIYLFPTGGGSGAVAGVVGDQPPPHRALRRAVEFRGKFLFRLPQVVLARSLFIASPPPSRSSISDANSCKLPSSLLRASCLLVPLRPVPVPFTVLAFLRGLDRAPPPSPEEESPSFASPRRASLPG